jgi:hypothetical protein
MLALGKRSYLLSEEKVASRIRRLLDLVSRSRTSHLLLKAVAGDLRCMLKAIDLRSTRRRS